MIRTFFFMIILLIGFTFIVKNTDQFVVLDYFLGFSTPPVPVYQLVAGAFIIGMLLAGILIFPEWIRMRLELKRQRKALQRVEEEIQRLRPTSPVTGSKNREAASEELEEP